jgi:Mn2+/Fe2+ NRAMP family transporter
MVKQPWMEILKATFLPHIEFNFQFLFIITGLLGTTVSPYMFFWQAQQTVEEQREKGMKANNKKSHVNKRIVKNLRIDTVMGMLFSEVAAWCIIVVAATVLHKNGVTTIHTAADAAKALEPLVKTFPHSGYIAKLLFGIGIIGLGLLSVPILAASASYALSSLLSIHKGLDLTFRKATGFYAIIICAMMIGLLLNFLGINPIKSLVFSAVINGVIAVPLIFLINLIASNEKIMGSYKSGLLSKTFVWITFTCMGFAAIGMFFTLGK